MSLKVPQYSQEYTVFRHQVMSSKSLNSSESQLCWYSNILNTVMRPLRRLSQQLTAYTMVVLSDYNTAEKFLPSSTVIAECTAQMMQV